MKNVHEPTYSFVILTFLLILIDTLLAWGCSKFLAVPAGTVSWLFIAVAFMILFTLWFGAYGAIAAYIGTLVGSGLLASDVLASNPGIAVLWAVAGLLQALIPLVAVRSFGVDLALGNRRDWTILILFGVVINNAVGAAWATWSLSLATAVNMSSVFSTWLISNVVVTIIIVPIALRLFTPKIQKSKLFVRNYWD